jgi:hypothetical protein
MRCADLRTIRMAFVDVPGFGAQDKSTWCDYVLKVYLDVVVVTVQELQATRPRSFVRDRELRDDDKLERDVRVARD